MKPEQYKEYINNVLKADDKKIFLGFFDVLKDEALIIKKGDKPEVQRLEIVGKQFDYWSSHPDLPVDLDLNEGRFGAALESYNTERYIREADAVFEKLKRVLDTCPVKRLVLPNLRHNLLFNKSAQILQLLAGKSSLEELTIKSISDKILSSLIQLLTHQECRVQSFRIEIRRAFSSKYSQEIASAMLSMKNPLKKFATWIVPELKLADAIYNLATNGTLTGIRITFADGEKEVLRRVIEAIVHAKGLEEVELPNLETEDELFKELAKAWKGNTTIASVAINGWSYGERLLNMALSLPSLNTLRLNATSEFDFLAVTTKLEKLEIMTKVTPVAAANIAESLARDTCQLQVLIINAALEPNALIALSAGLAQNRSLKTFKCELVENNDEGVEELTQSLVTQQGLEEIKIKGYLSGPVAQEHFIKFIEESKTIKKACFSLRYFNDVPEWPQRERLIKAIQTSNTLTKLKLIGLKKKK